MSTSRFIKLRCEKSRRKTVLEMFSELLRGPHFLVREAGLRELREFDKWFDLITKLREASVRSDERISEAGENDDVVGRVWRSS